MKEGVTIFTDGSSRGNPGPGGWGAIVVSEGKVVELGGRERETTNNRMELSAAIEALHFVSKTLPRGVRVHLYTDSSYVLKGATIWIHSWQSSDWKTKSKSPVLNRDLWEALSNVLSMVSVSWKLLPGHSGIPANERCDIIATGFADNKKPELFSGSLEDYSIDITEVKAQKAKPKKSRAKNKKPYSYVSEISGVVEIHKTWEACEARVKGKAARFKKVFSLEEEEDLIRLWKKTS